MPMAQGGSALFLQLGLTVVLGFCARKIVATTPVGPPFAATVRTQINKLVIWLTMPALVFHTVHTAPLGPDVIQVPAAAIAGMAGTALVSWVLLARLYGRTPETGGLVLAASAGSVSFFGIPIVRALFGPDEARVAVYFAVLNVPLALIAGALISTHIAQAKAAPGGVVSRTSAATIARVALRQVFTIPATWALIAGLALNGSPVPAPVDLLLRLLAGSVAPMTMFALGLGLSFERSLTPYRMALPAVAIKLAVSPLVVFVCASVIGLSGLPLAIVALQGAMPTQVLSVVVAERYRLNSRLVGLTLAMDTVLAFMFLPLVLGIIQTGVLS